MLDSKGLEPATTGAEFHDFLEEVARRSRPPRLNLILDEVEALSRETGQSLANAVRAVFTQRHIQQPFGKFVFIFSGSTDILGLTRVSPLKNIIENLYVPDFSLDETTELLITGWEEEGLAADPAISDRVYEWTHGHPYLSQRLGALMLEMVEEGYPLAVGLVDKAVERLQSDVNLQHIINSFQADPEAQVKVGEILQAGSQVHFSRNDPILARLEIRGVIRNEKGRCVIRNKLYEKALRSLLGQQPPEKEGIGKLKKLLTIHRDNLNRLEIQKARKGMAGESDIELMNNIAYEREKIRDHRFPSGAKRVRQEVFVGTLDLLLVLVGCALQVKTEDPNASYRQSLLPLPRETSPLWERSPATASPSVSTLTRSP